METVGQAKHRLIQGAIRHNLEPAATPKPRPSEARGRVSPVLMVAVVASVLYMLLPVQPAASKRAASAPPAAAVTPVNAATPVSAAAPRPSAGPPAVPASAPRAVARSVFSLAVKRIVLDPGHGGRQAGAISESGVAEKEITLDIAIRLRHLLETAGFDVLLTREVDREVPLEERVAFANDNGADVFVSIHVNWFEQRKMRPLETYYAGPTDDPAAIRLATAENRDSGFSLSAYRGLLERIYLDSRRDESRQLAHAINTELLRSLRETNPVLENRGVKTAPFVVLIGTQMPAILAEVSCLSNEDEVKLLTTVDYRDRIALALLRGIRAYAATLTSSDKKGS